MSPSFAVRWLAWQEIAGVDLETPMQFDRSSMAIQLAVDGAGVSLESVTLALPEIRSGRLVPFNPAFAVADLPAYWLVCPPRHLNRRGVRAFREWLQQAAERHEQTARALLAEHGCVMTAPPGWGDMTRT